MRVRDLALSLKMSDAEVQALVKQVLGRVARDAEALPPDVVSRVRTLSVPVDPDRRLLMEAYADVKPLGAPSRPTSGAPAGGAAGVRARSAGPAVVTASAAGPIGRMERGGPPVPPSGAGAPGNISPAPGRAPVGRDASLLELRTAERDEALRAVEAAKREAAALRERAKEAEAERDAARTALARREASTMTLMDALHTRGLRGEDEAAMALRALLDARREGVLLRALRVEDPAALAEVLEERLLLLAEGETAPPGAIVVRVPPARSESMQAPAARAAASRLSTALLVRGWKRVLVVGANNALSRRLREALDPRLQLTFSAEARVFPADVVFGFGDVALPENAIRAVGRTLPDQLVSLADAVPARP